MCDVLVIIMYYDVLVIVIAYHYELYTIVIVYCGSIVYNTLYTIGIAYCGSIVYKILYTIIIVYYVHIVSVTVLSWRTHRRRRSCTAGTTRARRMHAMARDLQRCVNKHTYRYAYGRLGGHVCGSVDACLATGYAMTNMP